MRITKLVPLLCAPLSEASPRGGLLGRAIEAYRKLGGSLTGAHVGDELPQATIHQHDVMNRDPDGLSSVVVAKFNCESEKCLIDRSALGLDPGEDIMVSVPRESVGKTITRTFTFTKDRPQTAGGPGAAPVVRRGRQYSRGSIVAKELRAAGKTANLPVLIRLTLTCPREVCIVRPTQLGLPPGADITISVPAAKVGVPITTQITVDGGTVYTTVDVATEYITAVKSTPSQPTPTQTQITNQPTQPSSACPPGSTCGGGNGSLGVTTTQPPSQPTDSEEPVVATVTSTYFPVAGPKSIGSALPEVTVGPGRRNLVPRQEDTPLLTGDDGKTVMFLGLTLINSTVYIGLVPGLEHENIVPGEIVDGQLHLYSPPGSDANQDVAVFVDPANLPFLTPVIAGSNVTGKISTTFDYEEDTVLWKNDAFGLPEAYFVFHEQILYNMFDPDAEIPPDATLIAMSSTVVVSTTTYGVTPTHSGNGSHSSRPPAIISIPDAAPATTTGTPVTASSSRRPTATGGSRTGSRSTTRGASSRSAGTGPTGAPSGITASSVSTVETPAYTITEVVTVTKEDGLPTASVSTVTTGTGPNGGPSGITASSVSAVETPVYTVSEVITVTGGGGLPTASVVTVTSSPTPATAPPPAVSTITVTGEGGLPTTSLVTVTSSLTPATAPPPAVSTITVTGEGGLPTTSLITVTSSLTPATAPPPAVSTITVTGDDGLPTASLITVTTGTGPTGAPSGIIASSVSTVETPAYAVTEVVTVTGEDGLPTASVITVTSSPPPTTAPPPAVSTMTVTGDDELPTGITVTETGSLQTNTMAGSGSVSASITAASTPSGQMSISISSGALTEVSTTATSLMESEVSYSNTSMSASSEETQPPASPIPRMNYLPNGFFNETAGNTIPSNWMINKFAISEAGTQVVPASNQVGDASIFVTEGGAVKFLKISSSTAELEGYMVTQLYTTSENLPAGTYELHVMMGDVDLTPTSVSSGDSEAYLYIQQGSGSAPDLSDVSDTDSLPALIDLYDEPPAQPFNPSLLRKYRVQANGNTQFSFFLMSRGESTIAVIGLQYIALYRVESTTTTSASLSAPSATESAFVQPPTSVTLSAFEQGKTDPWVVNTSNKVGFRIDAVPGISGSSAAHISLIAVNFAVTPSLALMDANSISLIAGARYAISLGMLVLPKKSYSLAAAIQYSDANNASAQPVNVITLTSAELEAYVSATAFKQVVGYFVAPSDKVNIRIAFSRMDNAKDDIYIDAVDIKLADAIAFSDIDSRTNNLPSEWTSKSSGMTANGVDTGAVQAESVSVINDLDAPGWTVMMSNNGSSLPDYLVYRLSAVTHTAGQDYRYDLSFSFEKRAGNASQGEGYLIVEQTNQDTPTFPPTISITPPFTWFKKLKDITSGETLIRNYPGSGTKQLSFYIAIPAGEYFTFTLKNVHLIPQAAGTVDNGEQNTSLTMTSTSASTTPTSAPPPVWPELFYNSEFNNDVAPWIAFAAQNFTPQLNLISIDCYQGPSCASLTVVNGVGVTALKGIYQTLSGLSERGRYKIDLRYRITYIPSTGTIDSLAIYYWNSSTIRLTDYLPERQTAFSPSETWNLLSSNFIMPFDDGSIGVFLSITGNYQGDIDFDSFSLSLTNAIVHDIGGGENIWQYSKFQAAVNQNTMQTVSNADLSAYADNAAASGAMAGQVYEMTVRQGKTRDPALTAYTAWGARVHAWTAATSSYTLKFKLKLSKDVVGIARFVVARGVLTASQILNPAATTQFRQEINVRDSLSTADWTEFTFPGYPGAGDQLLYFVLYCTNDSEAIVQIKDVTLIPEDPNSSSNPNPSMTTTEASGSTLASTSPTPLSSPSATTTGK